METLIDTEQSRPTVKELLETKYKRILTPDDLLKRNSLPDNFQLNIGGSLGVVFFDQVGDSGYTAVPVDEMWRENIPENEAREMIRDVHMGRQNDAIHKLNHYLK